MAKVLNATCLNGKVTAEGVEVQGTTILGAGVAASTGVLILDENTRYYVPTTSPDLDSTLAQVIAALGAAISGLNAAAGGLSAIAPIADAILGPPAVAGAVSTLGSAAGSITTAKTALETLKASLR